MILLMIMFPNKENVKQRIILLIISGACSIGTIIYSIFGIFLYTTKKAPNFYLELIKKFKGFYAEEFFWAFLMIMISVTIYRDYLMFGLGLKDYHGGI